jgi:hypothetical protein
VAGPITFQLGADAVLGHGIALHSLVRGTIVGETSPRLPNCEWILKLVADQGAKIIANCGEAEQASGMEIAD